jgi:hypothetical protein
LTLPPDGPYGASARYGYFVVQVRSEPGETEPRVSGVLENLRTGERKEFASPEELGRLVRAWHDGPPSF